MAEQVGEKKVKPSNLEIGKLYQLQYRNPPKGDLLQTKEWRVQWSHENIRYDYTRFLLLSFICEISSTIAVPRQDLEDQSDNQFQGLFTVISNGIFYLENNKIDIGDMNFIIFFLGKLMIDVGIFPDTNKCLDCEKPIIKINLAFLILKKEGSPARIPITIESRSTRLRYFIILVCLLAHHGRCSAKTFQVVAQRINAHMVILKCYWIIFAFSLISIPTA